MGFIQKISERVSIETRSDSFRLIVGDEENYDNTEYEYADLGDMIEGLQIVKRRYSDRAKH